MQDILFYTDEYVFSYRVAGVCLYNDSVLLQKPVGSNDYAFPGGHVGLGETNEQTIIREFKEEMGANIKVGNLKWIGELFFPWGDKKCHQICLYYEVEITDDRTPKSGFFTGLELHENKEFDIEFHWIPVEKTNEYQIYPIQASKWLRSSDKNVKHFIYTEEI